MPKLVLFDGGDGGGLLITEDGVRTIPPFDPLVRRQIKAVSQLVVAIQGQPPGESDRRELTALATRLANLAVQQVEAIVGTLDAEASLIVADGDDGGFVCGTTGKAPVRLPHPPNELPSIDRMLARGVIDRSLVTFVQEATEQGRSAEEIFERPADVARELGVELSEDSARGLEVLAPSRLGDLEDPVAREAVTFFQRVLDDGRYVDTWAIRPAAVSQSLDVQLSNDAVERIIAVGAVQRDIGPPGIIWIVVGIVVGVILVATEGDAEVVDRSGRSKF